MLSPEASQIWTLSSFYAKSNFQMGKICLKAQIILSSTVKFQREDGEQMA